MIIRIKKGFQLIKKSFILIILLFFLSCAASSSASNQQETNSIPPDFTIYQISVSQDEICREIPDSGVDQEQQLDEGDGGCQSDI